MDYQSPSLPSLLSECVEYTSERECAEFNSECVEYTKCAPYSQYAEPAAPTMPFVGYIRKKYYLYEVTFGVYVLDPIEKFIINSPALMFTLNKS